MIAGNKTGMVFALDPATGKPALPVEERPVPRSTLTGEVSSPTQPFPTATPALVPQSQGADAVGGLTDADRKFCTAAINGLSGHTIFTPPTRARESWRSPAMSAASTGAASPGTPGTAA